MLRALLLFSSFGLFAADDFASLRARFEKPPASHRSMPLWVWNGEVTEEWIHRSLRELQAGGLGGVFIHPRPGLITPYLSDRWFALVKYAVEEGKKLGMEVWLYDENSYPSGFAGGHVPAEMPESYNQGQGLTLERLTAVPADASKYPVLLRRAGDRFADASGVRPGEPGDYYAFRLAFYPRRAWHGGFSYVDLLKPGVTEKFIELTMRGYERAIGAEFGKTTPGISTDEPNINMPEGKNCLRWTPDLFARFQERFGYDLRLQLPSLLEETGDWRKLRHDYYALLLDLFIDRWAKPWQRYAREKKLQWTGHYWEHGWPSPQHGPDNMAMYAYHDMPGIDMLFNQFREDVNAQFGNVRAVKELSSVANQLGRRRTLSETYGGAGWDIRFEDLKRLGDWEYVLGVNFMNQHISYQTVVGERKHDYPPAFTPHSPWWPHYQVLGDYFGRLSVALSAGEQVNRILVLEPTSSTWLYASVGTPTPRLRELGAQFQEFVTKLEYAQVEYDLGCERIIRDHGFVKDGKFVIGRRAYDTVILPPGADNLEAPTANLIEQFIAAGGRLIAVQVPAYLEGTPTSRFQKLTPAQIDISSLAPKDIRVESGAFFHHRRILPYGQLLFFTNHGNVPARGSLKLAGKTVARMDPLTGGLLAFPDGAFELPPSGSLLLYASNAPLNLAAPKPSGSWTPVAPAGALRVNRASPNVLTLDYCDLTLGGKTEAGLYFYPAAERIYKHFGLETNPWNTAVQYKTAILDQNRFAPDSAFRVEFPFTVEGAVDLASLQAVVERAPLWRVSINGQSLSPRPGAWWFDRDFAVYDIGAHARSGRNVITLDASPMTIHHELEPVYVLGNFNVQPAALGWTIVPAAPLALGDWTAQGLPHYGHSVVYAREFRLDPRRSYKVRLGDWKGSAAEVRVNGRPAGLIGWPPYECDITAEARAGINRIEVAVTGSPRNHQGPYHGKPNPGLASPWSFRSAPATQPPGKDYQLVPYGLNEEFQVLMGSGK